MGMMLRCESGWMPTVGSLFSGIGGIDLAAERAGMLVIWQCEIDPFCNKVLAKRWPDVKRYGDVRGIRGPYNSGSGDLVQSGGQGEVQTIEAPDVIVGGFPCQPVSVAGKRRGKADNRWLWPEMFRIICETRPAWACCENVPGIVGMGLNEVLIDLEGEGYQCQTFSIPACGVGAPHKRERIFILAFSNGNSDFRKKRRGNAEEGSLQECDGPQISSTGDITGADQYRGNNGYAGQEDVADSGKCESGGISGFGGQEISVPGGYSQGRFEEWPDGDGRFEDVADSEDAGTREDNEGIWQGVGRVGGGQGTDIKEVSDVADSEQQYGRRGCIEGVDNSRRRATTAEREVVQSGREACAGDSQQGNKAMANTNEQRPQRYGGLQECTGERSSWACCRTHEDQWLARSGICRISHGVPHRVDRLRALGNAVVPQQIYPVLKAIADQMVAV